MLKGISPLISPELLKVLCEMGHSDTIVFADSNFPARSIAQKNESVYLRLDGQGMVPLLGAVLPLFPLDAYVPHPVIYMQREARDKDLPVPILNEYTKIVSQWDERGTASVGDVPRQTFYDMAQKAACIVQTGETAIYANIILQKGVVK